MVASPLEFEKKMDKTPPLAAPTAALGAGTASSGLARGRVVSIDILRGLAILWVIVFHLWADLTLHPSGSSDVLANVRDAVLDGKAGASFGAVGEFILSQGYLGVAVFMMLSGLSLTMNACRRDDGGILLGYATRFGRLLPAYWGGVLLLVATVAVIALLQQWFDGGSYHDQWFNVRIGVFAHVNVVWQDVAWALTGGAWIFRRKAETVPTGSLWFVELLLSYYLIFPFALRVLRRVGPWWFALGGIAFTLAARGILIPNVGLLDVYYGPRLAWALAPFRASEFFIGMSIGYMLAMRREEVGEWVRAPFDTAGFVTLGVLGIIAGLLLEPMDDAAFVFSEILLELGIAALMIPLVFKQPGRLEVSAPARALVFLGIVSFTALIVNDMMRYVSSFLRYEDVPRFGWWFFLWAVYVPVGTLLAYPLAWAFRLLPSQRTRAAASAALVGAAPVRPTRRQRKQARREERRGAAGVRP